MPQNYTPEFKKKIICLHEEEGYFLNENHLFDDEAGIEGFYIF